MGTRKNLHSHHFKSPISNNFEFSAFGEDGEGDEGSLLLSAIHQAIIVYIK